MTNRNSRNQSSRVSLGRGRGRTPPGQRRPPCPPSPLARNPSSSSPTTTTSSSSPSPSARPLSSPFPKPPASNQQTRLSPRGVPPSRGPGGRPGQRVSTLAFYLNYAKSPIISRDSSKKITLHSISLKRLMLMLSASTAYQAFLLLNRLKGKSMFSLHSESYEAIGDSDKVEKMLGL